MNSFPAGGVPSPTTSQGGPPPPAGGIGATGGGGGTWISSHQKGLRVSHRLEEALVELHRLVVKMCTDCYTWKKKGLYQNHIGYIANNKKGTS